MRPSIAVVDDEPRLVEVLTMVLGREGYDVDAFGDSSAALAALAERRYDLVLTDLRMPGPDGIALLRRVREIDGDVPVVLMTAYATVPTAVEAMKSGAFDYVQKPFDNDALKAVVRRALDVTRLARENRYLRSEVRSRHALESIVAESRIMRDVLDRVRRAARSRATVLITGESGTGKELIARAVHYHSDRVGGPFVALNCKALAPGVIESELFGHERGAFTGAGRTRPGVFEQADGGTLFLDEIGEIDADFQAKLLRVLQDRTVRRVGGERTRTVDVRVVAATNRDLRAEVDAQRFREDLFFRLAVLPIHVAPLRERREDVVPLARHFLARFVAETGARVTGWSQDVERWLASHHWPGNVRELENAIERGVVLARGERVELEDVLDDSAAGASGRERSALADTVAAGAAATLREFLDVAATEKIRAALADCRGVRAEAARRLGVDRATLYRLLRKYGLDGSD